MLIEVVVLGALIVFVLHYTNRIDGNRFIDDNRNYFLKMKESDYEFLVKARYGDGMDMDKLFNARLRNALIVIVLVIFFFLSDLSYVNILFALLAGYGVFKLDYMNLKNFYKSHLHKIDSMLPHYLKSLEILIQHYTVPVAIGKSIDDAPEIFREGLRDLIEQINQGNSTIDPYMEFARKYPVRDSMRMMRLLYRLSLGRQERKQEQLLMFARTISNLQQKARDTMYKNRLEKMEGKTMSMLITTAVGVMILLVLSVVLMMGI